MWAASGGGGAGDHAGEDTASGTGDGGWKVGEPWVAGSGRGGAGYSEGEHTALGAGDGGWTVGDSWVAPVPRVRVFKCPAC